MSPSLQIVFNILSNASGVTSLVPAASITPQRVEAGEDLPYITLRRISRKGWHSDSGTAAWMDTVEVRCYAKEQNSALDIEEAVIAALNRKTPGTYNSQSLLCLTHDDGEDLTAEGADADGVFYVASRFMVNYG